MNVLATLSTLSSNERTQALAAAMTPAPARRVRRERDFGVGYGASSGYASGKRYTSDWAQPRFRFS